MVKDRTLELENALSNLQDTQHKLLQSEKMASIGQLAAGVAHEINNPMGFISSNLGSLRKYIDKFSDFIEVQSDVLHKNCTQKQLEALEKKKNTFKIDFITKDVTNLINESLEGANRVKKIVQDLKSFSHVDEMKYEYADINECIESTINIIWSELKYKATVKKDYGSLPRTKCYAGQLSQVFMNILVNAVHSIETQGEITIKTYAQGDSIHVAISDTGYGIPPDKISKIFEPFYTTKEVGKGTGLGLSIAYNIIKKHNGEFNIKSEVGKGTTFIISIPVVE
jgi:two-component system NtrC family sensor kinase